MKLNNIGEVLKRKFVVEKKKSLNFVKGKFSKKDKAKIVLNDIEINHNHSWYQEIYERNKNNMEDIAILYKGNKITYRKLFDNIESYAKSLKQMGISKDSEIPVCISNCPEVVYLMGAASLIGAKLNLFGSKYPSDYITEIINGCNCNIIFIEDNYYEQIKSSINNSNIKKIILISLADSLKNGVNPYLEFEKNPTIYDRKVDNYKKSNSKIIDQYEFIKFGKDYNDQLNAFTDIDTEFVITYTSGSTNEKRPKAIVHTQRSFITVGRFHNKDTNGGISLKPFTFLAHIPTFSNTNLVSCISDALIQGGKLAMEPYYDKNQFLNTLLMYKPHYVAATKSFWVNAAKNILFNKKYKNAKLSNLFLAFSCGESFELNEEKFVNRAMKRASMGTNITHTPISILKMSEAAGDCEHGSILYTLFREYSNFKIQNLRNNRAEGLKYFDFVDIAVLDENGNVLSPNKLGRLVANSPCTMKCYKNNPEATNSFFIKDSTGKKWADMNVYGYIDNSDRIHMHGRIPKEGEKLPPFLISREILKDTKNILSCEVIRDDEKQAFVAYVEIIPTSKKNVENILFEAYKRCELLVNNSGEKLFFRLVDFQKSFPLTKSGKRDVKKLKMIGLTNSCVTPLENDGNIILENYSEKSKKKIK